ncbi:MAG: hypothetical protein NT166_25610 [Candidatus Aminicenantes bacterium]|nr:hypothetical protein [Candidatus Aminicenantes bacterium]
MRKIISFTAIFSLGMLFLSGSELGNLNLKGIRYIITAVQFNGVLYGEAYEDRTEETFKEFNLEETAAKLKEGGIPLDKENIRGIYRQMVTQLQNAELKVLKMKKYSDEKTTVIPTLTAGIDIVPIGGGAAGAAGVDLDIVVVHMTLSKWFSNWTGSTRILAPVYTWSEKKITTSPPGELLKTIETTVTELTGEFIKELSASNQEVKPEPEKVVEKVKEPVKTPIPVKKTAPVKKKHTHTKKKKVKN